MERWRGKVALVTGASLGLGAEIAKELVNQGMKVYGCSRSLKSLEAVQAKVKGLSGAFFPLECDLRDEKSILKMFTTIQEEQGGLHVLVNNAGIYKSSTLLDAPTEDWREMLDVMVLAPSITAREAVKSMKKNNVTDGHIINISSIGPYDFPPNPQLHFPCATKFAINALTRGLRQELLLENSNIRVSEVSPGITDTWVTGKPEGLKTMQPSDIAATIIFMLSAPPHCNVFDVLIRPTGGF